ncbi:hypothetical protein DXT91_22925 [Agrobacterium tumefaciens]|uniref:phospholipase D family protein n=1 Tax=Agrobacterium tumefaciens TaxID=358 RepID=UPI0012BA35BC|nr:phospholipase D family protein [Agrobacterium tumefaciens]MQB06949.1 hypothetical protein [Agrobacterium tumefaciens]
MWVLQTPQAGDQKILGLIGAGADSATEGAAAFAFATSAGIKMLEAEPGFKKLLTAGKFTMVVGLDAITDTNALKALESISATYPNFQALGFLHANTSSLFHPKTLWFRSEEGGAIITGSGNLTAGGLNSNWEAASFAKLDAEEIQKYCEMWSKWIADHNEFLLPLSDPKVIERAAQNRIQKAKIKKALLATDQADVSDEVAGATEEAIAEIGDFAVLIAEVPKSGNRWKQVNFDIGTYQNFFGVTLGFDKDVEFREVRENGTLGDPEYRHAVAVKSQNYRFEVGAAANLPYPATGHPITIFQRVTDQLFYYVLLMPSSGGHKIMQDFLDANYPANQNKKRVVITLTQLKAIWPDANFFS